MCVSLSEFAGSARQCRRCVMTDAKRADASARRQENRVTVRTVTHNVRSQMSNASAAAVASLAPSSLSNLLVSLEAVSPGISSELLRSPSGALRRVPGMHNDVFSEVRENSNDASAKINGGKSDPMVVTKIQLASALCERDLVADGAIVDPLDAAAELELIETRIDAIASGAMSAPAPGTTFDQLPERTQKFYARHTLDEIGALTTVSQRMSDKLFEDVTEQAQVAASPRPASDLVKQLSGEQDRPLTVADLIDGARRHRVDSTAGIQMASGATLVAGAGGGTAVLVDGVRLPVEPDARVADVLARIPDVDFEHFTRVPAGANASGLNTAVQSMLVGKSPRAQSMRLAARRRILERTFYGDTPMGYTADASGSAQLLAGKARAHTAAALASRPHSSRHGVGTEAQTTRIEGFDLSRHLRFARAARKEFLQTKVPPELLTQRAAQATLKRYAGSVSKDNRDAAARAGFQIRHRSNTLDADYPGAREKLVVDWNAVTPVHTNPPGKALCPEHADVRADGVAMVAAANQIARHGRNPELAGAQALLAEAKLASAFEVHRAVAGRDHQPRVLTSTQVVPSVYRGREAEFIAEVFPTGGAFTTKGYTLTRRDGNVRGGAGRVRVRYLTGDAMPVTNADIIDTKTTFRVISAEVTADGTVEVRAVDDQLAAQLSRSTP
ncbi:hypothetical protein H8Z57_19685 [Mycolicibacterium fortuitum]|nr:hypothetical protein H8Z57_19685 [Mycolicibacterium fortuitum]